MEVKISNIRRLELGGTNKECENFGTEDGMIQRYDSSRRNN